MIKALYFLFVLSGAAGLIYESIWTRYLGLFVGHGAYAQIIVLVIFLGGMSLGAVPLTAAARAFSPSRATNRELVQRGTERMRPNARRKATSVTAWVPWVLLQNPPPLPREIVAFEGATDS